jgi:coenzyme F420-0:L-glutamate ligase/coenzyme F420-1:gamma-L-glutamate ligase
MELLPIVSPLLRSGDDLASIIALAGVRPGDIIVVSSKALATVEGAMIDLRSITPSKEAHTWTERCGGSPAFRQAVLDEVRRLHGRVLPGCPQAMLTELKPEGLPSGVILAANAGLDESNAPEGHAIGWPKDPVKSVMKLRTNLEFTIQTSKPANQQTSKPLLAIILSDSTCRPRRIGVTAQALTVSGIEPVQSLIGEKDLYGKNLRMTQEAVADQLATAANIVMGNEMQSIPAVIIRDHGIGLSDYEGWVPGIEAKEDLFHV